MGKASKWMRNFLLGRKEEREKKRDNAEENEKFSCGFLPPPPTVKRRWSFGRSSKEKGHRNSKSLDSINTISVEKLATVSFESQQRNVNNLAPSIVSTSAYVLGLKPVRYGRNRAVANAAATKIQAAFRSYLARRALCALRALVKLQALVRGHLVRKQTTTTIRRMHALMSIQVRARFQRIQMAGESQSQVVLKSHSLRYKINPLENQFRRLQIHTETLDTTNYETLSKSKYDYLKNSKIGKTVHGDSARFTGEISFAKREEHQYEKIAFSTAQKTPQRCHGMNNTIPGRASFTYQQPVSSDFTFQPNYMGDTESSKAKSRSQSEPRQRPELNLRTRSKRWDSNNRSQHSSPRLKLAVHDGLQHSSPRLKHTIQDLVSNGSSPGINGNQDPWFMKLYQSKRLVMDNESDANSTNTSHSNYCNSVIAYEHLSAASGDPVLVTHRRLWHYPKDFMNNE